MRIQKPKTFMGIPVNEETLKRVLAKQSQPDVPVQPMQKPVVQNNSDFWTLGNVLYRDNPYTVDLSKQLLDNGNSHTQDEWASIYEAARNSNGFHTPDFPLFYGIVKAIKDADLTEAREFIKATSRANWLMTLTRISHQPSGNDLVIHNYGTRNKWQKDVDFITPDECIKNTQKPEPYQVLLGTRDSVQEINEVFHWLNGTDTYTWKVNSKPNIVDERVAWFVAYSGGTCLYCGRSPSDAGASLGVRFRAKKI